MVLKIEQPHQLKEKGEREGGERRRREKEDITFVQVLKWDLPTCDGQW